MHNQNSKKESLDIINENDEVIDSKPRSDIHNKGLLHREVHVWLFDKNNNIFFQKRGVEKSSAGLLDASVGGHVDKGEDYLETAVRETKEEIGISILPTDLILLKKFRNTSKEESKGTINNFLRAIYIYKYAISEEQIKKEDLLGVDFQKISPAYLSDISAEDSTIFDQFILTDEIPDILKYLRTK